MNNSFPLDMGQFGNVLFSTRIPQKDIDFIQKAPQNTKHVAVFYKGRAYKVDAFDERWVVDREFHLKNLKSRFPNITNKLYLTRK